MNNQFQKVLTVLCLLSIQKKNLIEQIQSDLINSISFLKQLYWSSCQTMLNLLVILQTIIKNYSHLPITQLFENSLFVSIFLINNTQLVKELLFQQLDGISKAKAQLFLRTGNISMSTIREIGQKNDVKRTINSKKKFIYVSVNHSKLLPLHKNLLQPRKNNQAQISKSFVENLICITQQNQLIDNLLLFDQKLDKQKGQKCIKGFLMNIIGMQGEAQQIIDQVSIFLSINQFFHSHIGLVLSIHEVNCINAFKNLIMLSENQFKEDDDQILQLSLYCRIFEALPFKITFNEIANLAQIDAQYWGQTIRIEQGNDALLFWFLLNQQPILLDQDQTKENKCGINFFKMSLAQLKRADKYGLKISEQKYGHIVLKAKALVKETLQNLSSTIVIVNIKRPQYYMNIDRIFGQIFEKQIKTYNQNRLKEKQFMICQKIDNEIDRLSELLSEIKTDSYSICNKQLMQQEIKLQAQELSYNIRRNLFIKEKK